MTQPSIPIAIIGAGCHFPGGRDLDAFFQFLLGGGEAIAELPADRYDASLYYDPKPGAYGKSYCWSGAMLDVRDLATPVVSSLAPERAARLDPLQKLSLGVAGETFASAGLSPEQLAGRDLPVILGVSRPNVRTFDHAFAHAIEQVVAPLDEAMAGDACARDVRAEVVRAVRDRYGGTGDDPWPPALGRQVAGLVANAYGLTGRHAVIDAACASTFAALAAGKRALEQRSAGLVLIGAAAMFDPYTLVMFAQSRALTGGGSYPFDARANGFVPGEGCGMFLLERLDDAVAHGRRILGVIRAIGSSCDGSGKGTWAPRKEGQVLAIERAYAGGHVDPAEVELVEAHATSTRLGDATEIAALGEFFGRHAPRAPLLVGSVKGNIGHALSAAGAAGLAKVLGAFRSGVIPPSIGYRTPNPDIDWERVPLRVVTTPSPAGMRPRVAALDSFGIGGINYHVVVEAPPSRSRAEELVRRSVAPSRAQVAIVGTGSFLAGARGSDEFARVVAAGRGRFRRLPASRVALDIYHQAGAPAPWRTCVVEAALVDEPEPDARQLKIPPKLLANYDPLQFIILDAANQAFAGLARREAIDRRRVAVFVGSSQISDFFIELTLAVRLPEVARLVDAALAARGFDAQVRARILAAFVERARRSLPELTEESSASVASGLSARTAKALDVNGPVFTIDSGGTGAALAALEAAVEALRSGDCDVAIAGGGDRALRIDRLAQSCAWGGLAGGPPGDGQLPGEGAAMVVLRRQGDAIAAGDTILATIAAIGSSTAGSLARARRPGSDTVERAVARAFERADVAPASVQYLVTDVLGPAADAPDLVALERRYGDVARDPLPLGSAPSVFGHCDGATGMVSLQMALVALRQGAAPPARALRARVGGARGRLEGFAEPTPLRACGDAAVAVTSAGDWGTQYHVVLGAPPGSSAAIDQGRPTAAREPIVFRAASRAALWAVLQPLRGQDLSRFSPGELIGRGEVAVAIRASSLNEGLEVALTALTSPEAASVVSQGVAISEAAVPAAACFLFPGLGSPYEGMLRALVDAYPAAARRLVEIDALVGPVAGRTMSDVLEHEPRLFGETVVWAQFASLTANLVTFEVAATHGFEPAFVSGHSFGEYAALVVAGAISLEHAVGMAAARAEHIARTTRPGAMTSVFASRARVAELLEGLPGFSAASNINSPDEVVVSGDHEATAALLDRCRRESVQARQLAVPAPFHCELLRPACEPFARAIAQIPIRRPSLPVISTATSREIADPEQIRRALVAQLVEPVDFVAQIEYAYARGVRRFIETGAGNVLARLTSKILGRRPAVMVSFDERRKREKAGVVAVENALVVLRASEASGSPTAAPATLAPAPPPVAVALSALFTADEWRELANQPDWEVFWGQARPSLALFARDLYARSRPPAPAGGVASATSSAPPAEPRPKVKMFDATAMRRSERERAPAQGPPEAPARPAASSPDRTRLVEEVSGFLTDLVVKQTGYPRELVRFDQELEADLGVDTVKQVELLGAIRAQLDLPADESVTVSDLPTLAELRDYVISRLSASDRTPMAPPSELHASAAAPADPARLVEEVGGFLIDLVVKQTGYPRELVRFDQELEADLGIDTVKQVELLGAIRAQLDLPADESVTVSDLPTLAELRDYVVGQLQANVTPAVAGAARPRARTPRRHAGASSGGDDEDSSPGADAPLGERIDVAALPGVAAPAARVLAEVTETAQRFVPRSRLESLASPGDPYRPAHVIVAGEGAIADELARAFEGRGANVARLDVPPGGAARGLDAAPLFAGDVAPDLCLAAACGRVPATPGQHLAAVAPLLDGARLEWLVEVLRAWLRRVGSSRATLSAVTSLGGLFGHANLTGASLEGAGLVGLLRALRLEHPTLRIKAVDVDPWAPADGIARALLTELDGACPKLWAGWFRGERRVPALVPTLPAPIDDERLAHLRRMPYILVTGGARGITAELAVRLAELGLRRLHLVGRTTLPEDLPRWRSLAASGQLRERVLEELRASGRAIDAAAWQQGVARIEAALEIERNLHRIESLGTSVRYHAVDVGDRPRVAGLLAAVRGADGPVRGIVHGAGTQRSRAFLGKPLADFHDTLAPKLAGAVHLMELTAGDPIELFVCLSSVAGQFGNLGQTDYGLASAALDALVAGYATAFPARRACAIAWPAWDEVGMAVRGGTREQLERRGRRLMSVAEGGNHFVREILGAPGEVIVTIAGPSVGDPDELRPAPARLDELHGAARAAEALPLVDAVVAVGPGEIEIEHHAHAAADTYLVDHVLGGAPLLPGVVGLELLAEAASAARGGERVDVLEDVAIELPFKLAPDGHGVLRARARPDGDAHAVRLVAPHVDRSGRLVEAERVLVQGRARRGPGRANPLAWREIAGHAVRYRYRTAAEADGTHVVHGPSLQTLVEIVVGDDRWHAARLRALPASALRGRGRGVWCVPAPLLDGCLAACGALLGMRGITGLPRGFGRVELLLPPRDGEECRVLVHERAHDEREAHFDFTAWGEDGRVLFVVEDFVRRSFA